MDQDHEQEGDLSLHGPSAKEARLGEFKTVDHLPAVAREPKALACRKVRSV